MALHQGEGKRVKDCLGKDKHSIAFINFQYLPRQSKAKFVPKES